MSPKKPSPATADAAPPPPPTTEADAARFRRTLANVMTVQVATLLLLWWLQATFTP